MKKLIFFCFLILFSVELLSKTLSKEAFDILAYAKSGYATDGISSAYDYTNQELLDFMFFRIEEFEKDFTFKLDYDLIDIFNEYKFLFVPEASNF